MTLDVHEIGRRARVAARQLALAPAAQRRRALELLAVGLREQQAAVLEANALDVADARAAGLSDALIDRLLLTPARLAGIAADTEAVAGLPDPLGERFDATVLPNGLRVHKRRTPLGVIGAIYESRPNVTVDIAALCLMAGSACILRGGSETRRSVAAFTALIGSALAQAELPAEAVQALSDPSRELVRELLRLDQYVDMIIPRGGAGLHRFCRENATIPVITGGIGVCHLFVEQSADLARAIPLIHNAKVQRPSVCNALDTLLVDAPIAEHLLAPLADSVCAAGVELRCDARSLELLTPLALTRGWRVVPAAREDFGSEFMALILSIRVLEGLDQAIEHIQQYGSGHSDGILTADALLAQRFLERVDSAAVYVNASTRFTDGAQLGLGAEIAVSTQKLHARGPMGLRELCSYKWVVEGEYHVRS